MRLVLLLLVLAAASVFPALFALRIVRSYARIPRVPILFEGCVSFRGIESPSDVRGCAAFEGGVAIVDAAKGRVLVCADGTTPRALETGDETEPLERPEAIAATPEGHLYVLDGATGVVHLYAQGASARALRLGSPGAAALALDAEHVWVADTDAGRVCRAHLDLSPDASWGEDGCVSVPDPIGIASLGGGLLVASRARNSVLALDGHGRRLSERALTGHAGALCPAPGGRAYMADASTGRLWVLDATGAEAGILSRDGDALVFPGVRSASAARDGAIWVVDGRFVCRLRPGRDAR